MRCLLRRVPVRRDRRQPRTTADRARRVPSRRRLPRYRLPRYPELLPIPRPRPTLPLHDAGRFSPETRQVGLVRVRPAHASRRAPRRASRPCGDSSPHAPRLRVLLVRESRPVVVGSGEPLHQCSCRRGLVPQSGDQAGVRAVPAALAARDGAGSVLGCRDRHHLRSNELPLPAPCLEGPHPPTDLRAGGRTGKAGRSIRHLLANRRGPGPRLRTVYHLERALLDGRADHGLAAPDTSARCNDGLVVRAGVPRPGGVQPVANV